MKLKEVAKITVGQIMPRVSAENKNEEEIIGTVNVLAPKAISEPHHYEIVRFRA